MYQIPLTQGFFSLVDKDDFYKFSTKRWYADKIRNYIMAVRTEGYGKNKKTVYLHRLIMSCPKGLFVDHINHDTLDNRKSNLRICTVAENTRNSVKSSRNSSGYKGVSWNSKNKNWRVQINVDNRHIEVGSFKDKVEASKAYLQASKQYHRQFSHL